MTGETKLTFFLTGINNQNFIMQDRETGSWWQQISGEAIQGPLKGTRLRPVPYDELTFATWREEEPNGRILRPDAGVAAAGKYAPRDWEKRIGSLPVAAALNSRSLLPSRAIVLGISVHSSSKAYPLEALEKQNPILDTLGGAPIMLVLHRDGKSFRAFKRSLNQQTLELFAAMNSDEFQLIDSQTGSRWDFTGRAVSGPLAGSQLEHIPVIKDYWFDWQLYHPDSLLYTLR